MNRRQVLAGMMAAALVPPATEGGAVAGTSGATVRGDGELPVVLVLVRGALDGLAVAPVLTDPRLKSLRPSLDVGSAALPLTANIGLHPALRRIHARIRERQGALVLGVGPSAPGRSHFEAQDTLEAGGVAGSGWLNRVGDARGAAQPLAIVALTDRQPISLSGKAPCVCIKNPGQTAMTPAQIADLRRLYTGSEDPAAIRALQGLDAIERLGALPAGAFDSGKGEVAQFTNAARLVRAGVGTQAVFLELDKGFDTHKYQGGATGALAKRLDEVDQALDTLLQGLDGKALVLVLTEFGRTVAENGSGGTDHGHGATAFLFGPNVKPGVLGSLPDLGSLYEGRDLVTTLTQESVLAAATRSLGLGPEVCGGAQAAPGLFLA
jgi:uncharacterized protein (DUF1501 family)